MTGPCDGPSLIADDRNPSRAYVTDWWLASVVKMVESANAISDLYVLMETKKLSPTAYPFPGFCLLNAATIHLQCHVYSWQVNDGGNDTHRLYLKKDLEACHKMSLRWPLAVHWVCCLQCMPYLFETNPDELVDTSTDLVLQIECSF